MPWCFMVMGLIRVYRGSGFRVQRTRLQNWGTIELTRIYAATLRLSGKCAWKMWEALFHHFASGLQEFVWESLGPCVNRDPLFEVRFRLRLWRVPLLVPI